MNVPDFLPTLSSGSHEPNSGKACVMEYVSLLAGEPWSDTPSCTHPYLAAVARTVNDNVEDDQREQLMPLIGRLFGTAPTGECSEIARVDQELRYWMYRRLSPPAIKGLEWIVSKTPRADRIALLSGLLDEYDRLTGRTKHREVSPDELRELAAAVTNP